MLRGVENPGLADGERALRCVQARLKRPVEELESFPSFLYIEPVNNCNARCVMCGIDFNRARRPPMTSRLFGRIVQELSQHAQHTERVGLYVDCEPLLDADLARKLWALKRIGIGTTFLNSNASLLTPQRGQELIEAGLDMIYITIDSLNPSRYESIRRGLKFHEVYRNTIEFILARNRLNPRLVIRIQMILQDANRDEADDFVRHWQPLMSPVDQVVVRRAHDWGSIVRDIAIADDPAEINRRPCVALWSTLGVHSNGDVNVCCIDANNAVPLGNVQRQSIEEIWRSPRLAEIRQMHLAGQRAQIAICDGCPVWFDHDEPPPARHDGGIRSTKKEESVRQ